MTGSYVHFILRYPLNLFEFMFNEGINNVDDSVKSIFENSTIVEFRETDKDINNQINEKIK